AQQTNPQSLQARSDKPVGAARHRSDGATGTRRLARGNQPSPQGRSLRRDRGGRAARKIRRARCLGVASRRRPVVLGAHAGRARQIMRDGVSKRAVGKHIARFILVGVYSGTRHAAICGAALLPALGRGYVDLDRGVFYRRAQGAKETKKRQPPVRLPDRLLAHMRRWRRLGIATNAVVEWNGESVRSVRRGFAAAVKAAGLQATGPDRITPHVLRHTAATWAMQNGADLWQAAGFFGMTVEMLQHRY